MIRIAKRLGAALAFAAVSFAPAAQAQLAQNTDYNTVPTLATGFNAAFEHDDFAYTLTGGVNKIFQLSSVAPLASQGVLIADAGAVPAITMTVTRRTPGVDWRMSRLFIGNLGSTTLNVSWRRDGAAVGSTTIAVGASQTVDFADVLIDDLRISGTVNNSNFRLAVFDDFEVDVANLAPVVAQLDGNTATFTQGGAAARLDTGTAATVTDAASPDFDTGQLSLDIEVGAVPAEDVLEVVAFGPITLLGINVQHAGTTIGTLSSNGLNGNPLVVDLNASATPARVQDLVRAVAYRDANAATPSLTQRRIRLALSDGDGAPPRTQRTFVNLVPPPPPAGAVLLDFDPAGANPPAPNLSSGFTNTFTSGGFRFTLTENVGGASPTLQQSFNGPAPPSVNMFVGGVTQYTLNIERTTAGLDFDFSSIIVSNAPGNPATVVTTFLNGPQVGTPQSVPAGQTLNLNFGNVTCDRITIVGNATVAGSLLTGIFDSLVVRTGSAPPTIAGLNNDQATYLQNSNTPVAVDAGGNATVADVDSPNFNGGELRLEFVNNPWAPQDVLQVGAVGSISVAGATVSDAGTAIGTITANGTGGNPLVVTFNANATPARVTNLVRALQFRNTVAGFPDLAPRAAIVSVSDVAAGLPSSANVLLRVQPDALPSDVQVQLDFSGALGSPIPNPLTTQGWTISLTGPNAPFWNTFSNTPIAATAPALLGGATGISNLALTIRKADNSAFLPDALTIGNFSGGATLSVVTRNGATVVQSQTLPLNATQRLRFNRNPVTEIQLSGPTGIQLLLAYVDELGIFVPNTPPDVTTTAGSTAYTENAAPTAVDGTVAIVDPDNNWNGGTLRAQITAGALAEDRLSIVATGGISLSGLNVRSGATTVGTTSAATVTGGTAMTITFNANATTAIVQSVARAIGYDDTSESPSTATRTVTFTATDAASAADTGTRNIAVTSVNDLPVVTAGQARNVAENAANGTPLGAPLAATDLDGATFNAWTIVSGNTGGALALNPATGQLSVASGAALDREAFASLTLGVTVSDGTGTSATQNVVVNLIDVNDVAPVVTAGQSPAVAENSANGTVVGTLAASDGDVTPTTLQAWAIVSGNAGGAFALNPGTGVLTVANGGALDFEATPGYALGVTVGDGVNTSAVQNVTVAITDVNESPTVAPASFGIAENSAAATVVGTATASDPDGGQALSWSITAGNTGGAFAIGAGSGQLTVANPAALDFETTPTFTLTVRALDNGTPALSATNTVTVVLADANDAPVLNDQSSSVAENSAAGTVAATLAVSDQDPGSTFAFAITAGNTGGAFAIDDATRQVRVANPAVLDFETNPVFVLSVAVSDNGTPTGSDTAQVAINLTNVNDPPAITAGGTLAYTENDGPRVLDAGIVVTDVDSPALAGANVRIAGNYAAGQDVLAFTPANGITATFDPATGTLSLQGAATLANYRDALRSVTYANTSDVPSLATRTVEWQVDDGGATMTLSNFATSTVTLAAVNDPPQLTVPAALAGTEDTALALTGISVQDVDVQVGDLRVTVSAPSGTFAATGTGVVVTGGGTGTIVLQGPVFPLDTLLGAAGLTYTPAADANGPVTIGVVLDDLQGPVPVRAVDTRQFTLTLAPVNDAPTLAAGATLAYVEDEGPRAIDATVAVADIDSASFAGATARIATGYANGEDVLAFVPANGITGTFDAATGTLALSGTASLASWRDALRAVTYENTSDDPSLANRIVQWQVDDGGAVANLSNVATSTITVAGVNDAPTLTVPTAPLAGNEDVALPLAGIAVADVDVQGGELRATLTAPAGSFAASGAGVAVTGGGTATIALQGTGAALNALLGGGALTWTPPANATGDFTIDVALDDLQGAVPVRLVDARQFVVTLAAVNDAPTVTTPAAPVVGAISISMAGLVLADVDAAAGELRVDLTTTQGSIAVQGTPVGVLATGSGTSAVTLRGTLAALNAAFGAGSIRFVPSVSTGSATVAVRVDDQGNTGAGGALVGNGAFGFQVFLVAVPTLSAWATALLALLLAAVAAAAARRRRGAAR